MLGNAPIGGAPTGGSGVAATGVTYTLSGSIAAFTLIGTTLTSRDVGHETEFDVTPGSFALTGTAGATAYNRVFAGTPAVFTLGGLGVVERANYMLAGRPASIAITVTTTAAYDRVVSVEAANIAVAGSARLTHSYPFVLTPGTITISLGDDTSDFGLGATFAPASIRLAGSPASLIADRKFGGTPATYTLMGSPASLVPTHVSPLIAPLRFLLDGHTSFLSRSRNFNGSPALFSVGGRAASLRRASPSSTTGRAAFTVTGHDASLSRSRQLQGQPAAFTVTPDASTLGLGAFVLNGAPASITMSGSAEVQHNRSMMLTGGAFQLLPQYAVLDYSGGDNATPLRIQVYMQPDYQPYDYDAVPSPANGIDCDTGDFQVSSNVGMMYRQWNLEPGVFTVTG